jgi:Flp pilus assembly protein TadG
MATQMCIKSRSDIGERRAAGRRGQSIVELALVVPMVSILLLGGFDTTMLVSDKLTAIYAVRQGARLASELGGLQTNPGVSQSTLDKKIVRNVLAVTNRMASSTIQEIDIYQANSADGTYQAGDSIDQFDGTGAPFGQQTFTLDKRTQTPPNEASIGVRILWKFTFPAQTQGSLSEMDYAVMKAAPVLT